MLYFPQGTEAVPESPWGMKLLVEQRKGGRMHILGNDVALADGLFLCSYSCHLRLDWWVVTTWKTREIGKIWRGTGLSESI